MTNHKVAWVLLTSYVALLALSSCGIVLSFFFGEGPPRPEPPNVDLLDPPSSDGYGYHVAPPQEVKDYAETTDEYARYYNDPKMYLVLPCGVSILVIVPLLFGGLCSRKLFSTTAGLYSSVALWGLNIAGAIMFQNIYAIYPKEFDAFTPFLLVLLGMQVSMLVILTLQIVLSAWELRRQKIAWPVFNFSHIFCFNTVFLVARIVVGCYMIAAFVNSHFMRGLPDPKFKKKFEDYYWDMPKLKTPGYLVYPVFLGLVYGVIVPCESLLSHVLGSLNTKMLSYTTCVSCLFYGMTIVFTSPALIQWLFSAHVYPECMNWAFGLMFLSLVHASINIFKSSALNAHPPLASLINADLARPSIGYSSAGVMNTAAALRNKFKGSDTLLFNSILLGLSSLAIILAICHEVWWWAGMVMVCGDVVLVSRVLPAVLMETLTQRIENIPVLKTVLNVVIECGLLLVGCFGSFGWFRDEIAAAIIINFLVVIMQLYKVAKNPTIRTLATNLAVEDTNGVDSRLISPNLDEETEDAPPQGEIESGGIYQPVA